MTCGVGYEGEMKRSKRHFDEQLDRLLAGDEVPEIGEEIVEVVARLQTGSAGQEPGTALATTLAAEVRQAESVPVRARSRITRPLPTRWRRRIMLSTFLSSLFGKLAIGAVALATTAGGLAATGNLPDSVQDWGSEQLNQIGIEIPHSEDVEDAEREDAGVLDVIENGDPEDGDEFGTDVADTASDEKSSDGFDTAEDQDENADVADEYTDEADTETPDEADDGGDNADVADDHRP